MHSNVFVVGHSKIGKTPLARRIAERIGLTLVSGSEWIKARYVPSEAASKDTATYIDEITSLSLRCLAENPDACIDFIRGKYDVAEGGLVIEGLRNPRDFMAFYRPDVDVVIFLNHLNVKPATLFERGGVEGIMNNVAWMSVHGIADPSRIDEITIDTFEHEDRSESHKWLDLDDAMDRAVWFVHGAMIRRASPRGVDGVVERCGKGGARHVTQGDEVVIGSSTFVVIDVKTDTIGPSGLFVRLALRKKP